jgi:hypothetical protein
MPKSLRVVLALGVFATMALSFASMASAGHTTDPRSRNVVPLGHSPWTTKFTDDFVFNNDSTISDIAFHGNLALQGSYSGFRFVDVSDPNNPTLVGEEVCGNTPPYSATNSGNSNSQGDITISPDGNVVVRSQDSGRVLPGNDLSLACTSGTGGSTALGFEGLQIFDTSNKADPVFVKAVFTDFGSHTHTQYYDRANNRLIIYVSRSGTTGPTGGYGTPSTSPYGGENWPAGVGCITAVEVPLANLAGSQVVNRCIPAGTGGCHDVSVYEGMKRLYGACRPNMILWDITDPVNPVQLHDQQYPGITGWHSATMSWNGQLLFAGWEPGGGTQPRCQATGAPLSNPPATGNVQTDAMKTIFAFRASDGVLVGRWILPQEQSDQENCTIHNINVVPHPHRHVIVGGHYQAGMTVTDYTDSRAPFQVAFSDPPCYDADTATTGCQGTQDPGAWSTHWYNGLIYESDIFEGINIWDINESWWENALDLPFLNPQTMVDRMTCRVTATGSLRQNRTTRLRIAVRVNGQGLDDMRVALRGAGVSRAVLTNASGNASVAVRPRRAGSLRVSSGALNVSNCATTKRVARAARRGSGVAGAGAGGGGAALSGRVR